MIKTSNLIRTLFVVLTSLTICHSALAQDMDELKRAMRDEIKRTLAKLSAPGLEKPYYVEYSVTFRHSTDIKATLGGIRESSATPVAVMNVGIRVGKPEFDNTNFFDVGLSFFGSGDDEEVFRNRRISVEQDYASLRRELWLATDAAYKQAAELFAKKEAAVKNRTRTDTTVDFIPMPAEELRAVSKIADVDKAAAELLLKNLSAVFRKFPEIGTSAITFEYLPEITIYVNSEGREYIRSDYYTGLEIVVSGQAKDGMPIAHTYTVHAPHPGRLPKPDSLMRAAENVAAQFMESLNAERLAEPYSGPVLFTGQAACELVAQSFAPNLVAQRPQLSERGVQDVDRYAAFQNKVGGRVMSEFLTVKSQPLERDFDGVLTIGNYTIDDEGVPAENITLVDKGYLKTLLSARVPTRRIKKSNGAKRGGAPMFSQIVVESDAEHSKVEAALRKDLLGMIKARDLPFGIIVRKILNQNLLYTALYEQTAGEYPVAQGDGKMSLLEVCKLFPDGRCVPIRGVEAAGLLPPTFKDIVATGNKPYVYNLLAPAVVSPFVSGGRQFMGATIVSPDLLFEDAEIRPVESDFAKPPLLPSPLSTGE